MARMRDVLDDLAEWYPVPAGLAAEEGASAHRSWFGALPDAGARSAAQRTLIRVVEAFLAWHDRARQRRALLDVSDHMLRDIGISRAQALGEAHKPFWRV